jgi:hypothetical protein
MEPWGRDIPAGESAGKDGWKEEYQSGRGDTAGQHPANLRGHGEEDSRQLGGIGRFGDTPFSILCLAPGAAFSRRMSALLVCEAIEPLLAREEAKHRPAEASSGSIDNSVKSCYG